MHFWLGIESVEVLSFIDPLTPILYGCHVHSYGKGLIMALDIYKRRSGKLMVVENSTQTLVSTTCSSIVAFKFLWELILHYGQSKGWASVMNSP